MGHHGKDWLPASELFLLSLQAPGARACRSILSTVSGLGAFATRRGGAGLAVRMVLGTALAAIALAVFHDCVNAQYTFAVRASTGLIWHGQTPFSWSSGAASAAP
jgi:hypothetical protein